MRGKINGKAFEAERFGFDGCHKFFLCDTPEGERRLLEYEYELFPIESLPEVWRASCPLRFIYSGDFEHSFVEQGEDAVFEGWEV